MVSRKTIADISGLSTVGSGAPTPGVRTRTARFQNRSLGRLDEVVERAIKTVKALPEFEPLMITSQVGPECQAWFDPGKVERVLLNLLFNAAEAVSPTDGHIEVGCEPRQGGVDLRVTDNGPGIPEAIVGTLFEPFISHGKQKGTGLGLTVVHNVMHLHGGNAIVERTGPEGTTFLLRFPPRSSASV